MAAFHYTSQTMWPIPLEKRKEQLRKLYDLLTENEDQFYTALFTDLSKSKHEVLISEILPTKAEIQDHIKNMKSWTSAGSISKSRITISDKLTLDYQALGVVLVLGSWNYPVQLALLPVIGALSAGNCVLLKPSDMSPNTARLLSRLIPRYLDKEICQVFEGDAAATQAMMAANRFDFIFYTGNGRVGRLIMAEAAKTLTPVCLELGGKSPVYVHSSADLELAATRIMWGKILNAGQTCVAPDYVLCETSVQDEFVEECKTALGKFSLNFKDDPGYGRIVSVHHTKRLHDLLKRSSGTVAFGGTVDIDNRFVEPTLVTGVNEEDSLMEDELFGPVLPIIGVNSSTEAIKFVQKRDKPLAIYVFASDKRVLPQWRENTSSGGLMQNDCIMLVAIPGAPFGGVGTSGMGQYHGRYSVELFSHRRTVVVKDASEMFNNRLRYPPYDEEKSKWARRVYRDQNKAK